MIPLLMILLHLIPLTMILTIFLSLIFLTILLYGPHRDVMTLLSVWLAWKLKLRGGAGWRLKPQRSALLR